MYPNLEPYRSHRLPTSARAMSNECKPDSMGLLKPHAPRLAGHELDIEMRSRMLALDKKKVQELEGNAIAPEDVGSLYLTEIP